MSARPRIGVTVGDPAGIGPEIVGALLAEGVEEVELAVYGDIAAVSAHTPLPAGTAAREFRSADVAPGAPDPGAARGIVAAIRAAARDCLDGRLDAMVTAPVSKQVLAEGGFSYPGHTELLAETAADAGEWWSGIQGLFTAPRLNLARNDPGLTRSGLGPSAGRLMNPIANHQAVAYRIHP